GAALSCVCLGLFVLCSLPLVTARAPRAAPRAAAPAPPIPAPRRGAPDRAPPPANGLAVDHDGQPAAENGEAATMRGVDAEGRTARARDWGVLVRALARAGGRECLVDGNLDAGQLGAIHA